MDGSLKSISTGSRVGAYGLDAPGVVRNLLAVGVGLIALSWIGWEWLGYLSPFWILLVSVYLALIGCACLLAPLWMVWSSFLGKPREIERLFSSLALRGDERLVDLGCGRGLGLVAAMRVLQRGEGVGVDIWRGCDQWRNNEAITRSNLHREGVYHCTELLSADLRSIPLPDGSFDLALASLALHNISGQKERASALLEALRLLKPGGRLFILDFQNTLEYARLLREQGCIVQVSARCFSMFPPTRWVIARKIT